ncbi:MAG TPA: chorismate-binding protein [Streptosporangiaceae bacterium]|nr:chorismate-binding protein [Streptosporangiaceae bacterium]
MPAAPPTRVTCEPLDWDFSSAEVLRLVRADAHPAALLGAWAAGSDIVCSEPTAIRCEPELPWDALDEAWPPTAPSGPDRAVFAGGWIGYLGFGLTRHVLPVPPPPGAPRKLPAWWLGYYDHVLRHDRTSGRWYFEALRTPGRADALDARLAELCRRAATARPDARPYACGPFRLIPGAAAHRSAVRRAVDYIREGDIFQANICLRLEASFDGDPLDAFCAAVTRLGPPYAAYLRPCADSAVVSVSPELFLRREGSTVVSRPIKGTGPRQGGGQDAAAERVKLERSAKNRAENVMIVDLMRNDLSRVCTPGSVVVPRLATPEPHPGVWHLVSDVRGELCAEAGDGQLIRAAFPPGSVTGAPKVRALEVIHELEVTPREVYTGAIGYRSPLAGLELNVAIRTFEFHAGRVWLGAGGGIVAASRPGEEYRECLLKARPLIAALGGCLASGSAGRTRQIAGSDLALLPRPAAGVFTSLRVRSGAGRNLDAHLDRLADSARRLYGKELPATLAADLHRCLAARPTGRLRITLRPRGGPLHATVAVVQLDDSAEGTELVPVVVSGGIGAHKWADRRLLGRLRQTAGVSHEVQILIEDSDGTVLETDRANVFAVRGSVLKTPPADGRLLPGVARATVLQLAAAGGLAVEAAPLTRHDLLTASEVFVTNSVRGVLPVRSIAGTALPTAPGPVTKRIAAAFDHSGSGTDDAVSGLLARVDEIESAADAHTEAQRHAITRRSPAGAAPLVVVIDNYDSFTFNLVHYLTVAGCAVEVVRNDEVTPGQVMTLSPAGLVISPGPCAPHEAAISIDMVRACAASPAAVPVLGVCLGHQAIAAAFGASIIQSRPVHGQTSIIHHDGGGVLAGLPRRFAAVRYHSLIVDEQTVPSCLHITARTRGGIPMGLRHTGLPIEGVQFHPESVLTSYGHEIIGNFASALLSVGSAGRR